MILILQRYYKLQPEACTKTYRSLRQVGSGVVKDTDSTGNIYLKEGYKNEQKQ